jgi:hypothetical protein
MKKILISFVAVFLIVGSFLVLSYYDFSDVEGTISITIKDEIGDIISNKEYDFTSEDTLFSILDENYDLGCANSSFQLSDVCEKGLFTSRILLEINTLKTDWRNSYISIYENDEYSTQGIDNISLNDGDRYLFEYKLVGGDN